MIRLTYTRSLDGYEDVGLRDGVTVGDAICRLAAYENTGLLPEEVKALKEQAQQKKWCDYCKDADSNPYSDLRADDEFSRDNKFYFCPMCGRKLDGGEDRKDGQHDEL